MSSRPELATYVQDVFERLLFSSDDAISGAALKDDVAPDAEIQINGSPLTFDLFAQASIAPFRAAYSGTISGAQDLNVLSMDGFTGLVAQHTTFETVLRADESAVRQKATTLVRVEEKEEGNKEAGRWITGIWEIIGPA